MTFRESASCGVETGNELTHVSEIEEISYILLCIKSVSFFVNLAMS